MKPLHPNYDGDIHNVHKISNGKMVEPFKTTKMEATITILGKRTPELPVRHNYSEGKRSIVSFFMLIRSLGCHLYTSESSLIHSLEFDQSLLTPYEFIFVKG